MINQKNQNGQTKAVKYRLISDHLGSVRLVVNAETVDAYKLRLS